MERGKKYNTEIEENRFDPIPKPADLYHQDILNKGVPLLTHEREVILAKTIEAGKIAINMLKGWRFSTYAS